MQAQTLDATVIDYINEIKTNYEQRINELQNNYANSLKELQNKYETDMQEYHHKYLEIKEQYDLLVYKKFARSAEQLIADKNQILLFTEERKETQESKETEIVELTEVSSHKRKKCGRKAIAPHIERRERTIDIPEEDKTCACGAELKKIGEETSEKLNITPPQIYVDRVIRPKYACRNCEGTEDEEKPAVRIAPVEPSIIPRSITSPSLLSCIMIQKYEDHLPFYRQEKQFKSIGIIISRQDMCSWQQKVYEKLSSLFKRLKEIIKTGPVMRMDETTVQVMGEEGRSDTQKSYMWLAQGGPLDKKVVLYEYHETRSGQNAKTFLEGYIGYLQTDGYEGYDSAVKDMPGIIHVGCFAHARRNFFEASKVSSQSKTAEEGIQYIKKLYVIERKVRQRYEQEKDTEEEKNRKRKILLRVRQLYTWRVLNDFKRWLIKQQDEVPSSLLLGKAVRYTLNQWDKLIRYLESPYLTPDNNICENAIRPFVLGRKNWLFNKSPEGAESSCGMFSLIETAKQNGLIPRNYLLALFEKAPHASTQEDWEKLLPWNIFNP